MNETLEQPDFQRLAPALQTRMLVIGGCGGIGRRLVEVALEQGLLPAVIDTLVALDQHPVGDGVPSFAADVRDDAAVAEAVGQVAGLWGAIDVLVHLPGYMLPPRPMEEIDAAAWDDLIAVNLTSLHRVVRHALPLMRASGKGSIVTIASGLAVHVEKGVSAYAASKAGIIALTKALAKENAPEVRVNAVAPGAVDTEFLRGGTGRTSPGANDSWFDGKFGEEIAKTIPLGRIAVPDDVVGPILFLASDAARYMTGQVLFINGGRYMP